MLSWRGESRRLGRTLAGMSLVAALSAAGAGAALALPGQSAPATVDVTLKEWSLTPSPARVPAGKVVFRATNAGGIEHELVVLRANVAPSRLPVKGGRVVVSTRSGSSRALGIKVQGEIEDIAPGTTRLLVLTLRPGRYVLICNLLGHYKAGQFAGIRVTG